MSEKMTVKEKSKLNITEITGIQKKDKIFLPLGLDIEGVRCLIVGGGKIAFRKAIKLIANHAIITLVSPNILDEFVPYIQAGNISWVKTEYKREYLGNNEIIIAATSDKKLNIEIGIEAEALNKFCCVVSSAKDSNLIFPAVYSREGINVAVHSNGKNCLKSKYTKNRIADFLNNEKASQLLVLGISYQNVPGNISSQLDDITKSKSLSGLDNLEIAIISTCQRWECFIHDPNPNKAIRLLFDLIKEKTTIDLSEHSSNFYSKNGINAFHHILRLSSGLDSKLVGESEITSQFNSAMNKWLSVESSLRSILELACLKARKIRRCTFSDLQNNSWSKTAVSFIEEKLNGKPDIDLSIEGRGGFVEKVRKHFNDRLSNKQSCEHLVVDLNRASNNICSDKNYYTIDDIADSAITVETAMCKSNAEKKAIEQSLLWYGSTEKITIPTEQVKIGLRSSRLSLAQLDEILSMLELLSPDIDCTITKFFSPGDRDKTTPLPAIYQPDFFTRDIDQALMSYKIDMAIHSAKDLPQNLPDALCIAAITPTIAKWDCIVSRNNLKLADLPSGAKIGTSSRKRSENVKRLRPDLLISDIRGNVPDRIKQMDEGNYDAVILAGVGLIRLGIPDRITEILPESIFPITAGQGSLAILTRKSDKILNEFLRPLNLGDWRNI